MALHFPVFRKPSHHICPTARGSHMLLCQTHCASQICFGLHSAVWRLLPQRAHHIASPPLPWLCFPPSLSIADYFGRIVINYQRSRDCWVMSTSKASSGPIETWRTLSISLVFTPRVHGPLPTPDTVLTNTTDWVSDGVANERADHRRGKLETCAIR